MNKIYIVEYYGGQWEDSWDQILGVFDSIELAKKAEENLLFKVNEVKKNSPIYPNLDDYYEDIDLYEELWKKHQDYWGHNYEFEEFAGTRIQEFELNTPKL